MNYHQLPTAPPSENLIFIFFSLVCVYRFLSLVSFSEWFVFTLVATWSNVFRLFVWRALVLSVHFVLLTSCRVKHHHICLKDSLSFPFVNMQQKLLCPLYYSHLFGLFFFFLSRIRYCIKTVSESPPYFATFAFYHSLYHNSDNGKVIYVLWTDILTPSWR